MTAAAVLLGGASATARRDAAAAAAAPVGDGLQAGFSPAASTDDADREAPGALARRPATTSHGSTLLGARLPAARPRDRRPDVLHEGPTRSCSRALRLAPRDLTRDQRARARSRSRATASPRRSRSAAARARSRRRPRANYGVIGDALDRARPLPAAFAAFDTMATLQPSVASYARVSSCARAARRRCRARSSAMQLAVDAAARAGRGRGLDARPARQALLVDRPRRCRGRARRASRSRALSRATRSRSTGSRGRGGARAPARRDRARAAGRRTDPAAAVRRRSSATSYASTGHAQAARASSTR